MSVSRANGQRCLYCGKTYPLYPPILGGCLACATAEFKAPLELTFDYPSSSDWLPQVPLPGLERYAPMLPPIAKGLSMGEGGTPLFHYRPQEMGGEHPILIKDESRNPTWSHKDRLNLAVVSAALTVGAKGVVAASSCNHGGSAAAYSARAGLPGVILTTPRPPAVASFLQAYGQIVIAVPDVQTRWTLMARLIDEMGFHPASNQTTPPTNHPFGSENYKTIAYELFLQLGRKAPAAVFVPIGFSELIFGIYKGFAELHRYGLIDRLPRLVGCEPAAGAPLKRAIKLEKPTVTVKVEDSIAYSIAVPTNSFRGVVAIRETSGFVLAITEDEIQQAQAALSRIGIWAELSSAVAFAGTLRVSDYELDPGPVVCINTSSGFKDLNIGSNPVPLIDGTWAGLLKELDRQNKLKI